MRVPGKSVGLEPSVSSMPGRVPRPRTGPRLAEQHTSSAGFPRTEALIHAAESVFLRSLLAAGSRLGEECACVE